MGSAGRRTPMRASRSALERSFLDSGAPASSLAARFCCATYLRTPSRRPGPIRRAVAAAWGLAAIRARAVAALRSARTVAASRSARAVAGPAAVRPHGCRGVPGHSCRGVLGQGCRGVPGHGCRGVPGHGCRGQGGAEPSSLVGRPPRDAFRVLSVGRRRATRLRCVSRVRAGARASNSSMSSGFISMRDGSRRSIVFSPAAPVQNWCHARLHRSNGSVAARGPPNFDRCDASEHAGRRGRRRIAWNAGARAVIAWNADARAATRWISATRLRAGVVILRAISAARRRAGAVAARPITRSSR